MTTKHPRKDRDTRDMFPDLSTVKRKPPTEREKYDKLLMDKYQTDLFKKERQP